MAKEVKGHSFAKGTLNVEYVDGATEKFHDVTDAQHQDFCRTGKVNEDPESKAFGQPIHRTGKEQGDFLDTLRAKK